MLEQVFTPGGLLQSAMPSYECRPQQLQMARVVEHAIAEGGRLACEAPCGVGKTFAYLVPAIVWSAKAGRKVVVCTANIALQEQLIKKDLPLLRKTLQVPFEFRLIKGLGNYLCLDRFNEARKEVRQLLPGISLKDDWPQLQDWAQETTTGDRSDLDFEPRGASWARVAGVSELCNGPQCSYFRDCHAMNARRRLENADLIVCNYHLLLTDRRLRTRAGRRILPSYDVLICDEAHEMADAARETLGMRLTVEAFYSLARAASVLRISAASHRLRIAAETYFADVRHRLGDRMTLRLVEPVKAGDLREALLDFREIVSLRKESATDDKKSDKASKVADAALMLQQTVEAFAALDDENIVAWIADAQGGRAELKSSLIDPSEELHEMLTKDARVAVLTSATLQAGGSFEFFKREVGASDAVEAVIDTPFDFAKQAALVLPPMNHEPNEPEFVAEASHVINRVLSALQGRTMVLCTSYRNLKQFAERAQETGVRILKQGDRPRTQVLEEFRRNEGCALFATASFWQGVDIPGEALSCLIIDKLPFSPPDEPLAQAIQERDSRAFFNWTLPRALLRLKQGFGRLVRSKTDRGVVVLLDRRAWSASYAPAVLQSLPKCPVRRDLESVFRFFESTPKTLRTP